MQTTFINFIEKNQLCTNNHRILLGVSGGIDSVCMFHLFRLSLYPIAIAHCNFQLREKESDADEKFVQELADEFDIPFFSKRFNTSEIAVSEGISIQMAARDLRYEWFEEIRDQYDYDYIAIAHNSNDVIETFLINLSRGSGIKGFSGIKEKTGTIIRPLLFAKRTEINEWIRSNEFEFREDSSNKTIKYSRNLIRHEIIPLFEKMNPRFQETMIETIERLKETESIYISSVNNNIESIAKKVNQILYIDIEALKNLNPIQAHLHETLNPYGFSKTQINDIINSLDSEPGKLFLSLTHRLIKDRKSLILEEISAPNKNTYLVNYSDNSILKPIHLTIEKFELYEDFKINKDKQIGLFDLKLIEFPLTLRKWQAGDYFMPLGMNNLKKLSDFFIDNKLSIRDKENKWILESGNKIIWIVGERIDERFKITEKTKNVLQIELSNSF